MKEPVDCRQQVGIQQVKTGRITDACIESPAVKMDEVACQSQIVKCVVGDVLYPQGIRDGKNFQIKIKDIEYGENRHRHPDPAGSEHP